MQFDSHRPLHDNPQLTRQVKSPTPVATTDGMIYFLYFGSTLPNSKMSIAQAVGHKPMTSAEFKSYESK